MEGACPEEEKARGARGPAGPSPAEGPGTWRVGEGTPAEGREAPPRRGWGAPTEEPGTWGDGEGEEPGRWGVGGPRRGEGARPRRGERCPCGGEGAPAEGRGHTRGGEGAPRGGEGALRRNPGARWRCWVSGLRPGTRAKAACLAKPVSSPSCSSASRDLPQKTETTSSSTLSGPPPAAPLQPRCPASLELPVGAQTPSRKITPHSSCSSGGSSQSRRLCPAPSSRSRRLCPAPSSGGCAVLGPPSHRAPHSQAQ